MVLEYYKIEKVLFHLHIIGDNQRMWCNARLTVQTTQCRWDYIYKSR